MMMNEQIVLHWDFSLFINQTNKNSVLFDESSPFIYFRDCR